MKEGRIQENEEKGIYIECLRKKKKHRVDVPPEDVVRQGRLAQTQAFTRNMPKADVLVLAEVCEMIMEAPETMTHEIGSNQDRGIFYHGIEWIV